MTTSRLRLGELLVDARLITEQTLSEALEEQKRDGRRLGQILVERGAVDETRLTQVLSHQLSIPWVSLLHIEFSRQLLNLVPHDVAETFGLLPIYVRHVRGQGETLYVAMSDPTNEEALAACARHSGLPVRSMIASPSDIRSAIRVYYARGSTQRSQESSATAQPAPAPASPANPAPPTPEPLPVAAAVTPPVESAHPRARSRRTLPPDKAPPAEAVPTTEKSRQADADGAAPGVAQARDALPGEAATPMAAAPMAAAPMAATPSAHVAELDPGTEASFHVEEEVEVDAQDEPVPAGPMAAAEPDAAHEPLVHPPSAPPPGSQPTKRLRPRMVALTLLDGTTIKLPARRRPNEVEPPSAELPPANLPPEETELTARDLVAALRAVSHGADASEILGGNAGWESMFAALLSLLLKKRLIADWEFIEEYKKV